MKKLNDVLGYENLKIYQDDTYFSFSIDSVILANFVTLRSGTRKILDLCSGNAVVPIVLSRRTKAYIDAIEIQKNVYNLAKQSIEFNGLSDQISIYNGDVNTFFDTSFYENYDIITCNPPYFKYEESSFVCDSMEKAIARHEIKINMNDICSVSFKLLKNGGRLALVHRPERLMDVLVSFRNNGIEPKRLMFVYSKISKPAILFFIEGVKGGLPGLKVDEAFVLYNDDGTITDSYNDLICEVRK